MCSLLLTTGSIEEPWGCREQDSAFEGLWQQSEQGPRASINIAEPVNRQAFCKLEVRGPGRQLGGVLEKTLAPKTATKGKWWAEWNDPVPWIENHSPVGQIWIFSYSPAGEQFKTVFDHVIPLWPIGWFGRQ